MNARCSVLLFLRVGLYRLFQVKKCDTFSESQALTSGKQTGDSTSANLWKSASSITFLKRKK